MSVVRAKKKRAGTDPEAAADEEGAKRILFEFEDGSSKLYVTAERYVAELKNELVAVDANIFDAAEGYGLEVDLNATLAAKLIEYAERIRTARRTKMPVIIHCREGRVRSIICLGVYLMLHQNCSDAEAMTRIKDAFLTATAGGKAHAKGPGDRVERVLMAFYGSYMPGGPRKSEGRQRKKEKTTE